MQDVDVVFHLAALVSITEDKAYLLEAVNVEGTSNVIKAAKFCKVKDGLYQLNPCPGTPTPWCFDN